MKRWLLIVVLMGTVLHGAAEVQAAPSSGYNQFLQSLDAIQTSAVLPIMDEAQIAAQIVSQPKGQIAQILSGARSMLGQAVVWGGASPAQGFDCSGLTSYVYKNAINKILPRTTYGQITLGKTISVSTKKLKKGDLLFWGNYHVGIYVGNGKFVHAPAPGQNVKEQTLASFYPSSAKRVID